MENKLISALIWLLCVVKKIERTILAIILITLTVSLSAQDVLEYESISINGITSKSSSKELLTAFGEPTERYDPNYECGAYTKDQPGIETTELFKYPGFEVLLVNDTVRFRKISFLNMKENHELISNQIVLNRDSTIDDFKEVFPDAYNRWNSESRQLFRLFPCEYCDCQIQITFRGDKIDQIEFYCPC